MFVQTFIDVNIISHCYLYNMLLKMFILILFKVEHVVIFILNRCVAIYVGACICPGPREREQSHINNLSNRNQVMTIKRHTHLIIQHPLTTLSRLSYFDFKNSDTVSKRYKSLIISKMIRCHCTFIFNISIISAILPNSLNAHQKSNEKRHLTSSDPGRNIVCFLHISKTFPKFSKGSSELYQS